MSDLVGNPEDRFSYDAALMFYYHISDLCTAEEVKGFPTIKLYVKGRFLTEYNGGRTSKELLDFVNNAPTQKEEL